MKIRYGFAVTSALLIAAGTTLVAAGPAAADPAKGFPVTVSCDNGQTYDAVVAGNGDFTPAHDTGSNSILVPTSFHDFHGVLTDSEGNVIATEDEFFDDFKGRSEKPKRATSVVCTFSFSDTFEDPEFGEGVFTFTGSGGVNGFITPAR